MEVEMEDLNSLTPPQNEPRSTKRKKVPKKKSFGLYSVSKNGHLTNNERYLLVEEMVSILESNPESRHDFSKALKSTFNVKDKENEPKGKSHLMNLLKVDPKIGSLLGLEEGVLLTRNSVVKKIFDILSKERTEHGLLDVSKSPFNGLLGNEPVSYNELHRLVGPYLTKN